MIFNRLRIVRVKHFLWMSDWPRCEPGGLLRLLLQLHGLGRYRVQLDTFLLLGRAMILLGFFLLGFLNRV
jgi:hypothetical protein